MEDSLTNPLFLSLHFIKLNDYYIINILSINMSSNITELSLEVGGINGDAKYLDYTGLKTFYKGINSTWWPKKKTEVSSELKSYLTGVYLPLTGGELTGGLTVSGNIYPGTSGVFNLGKPETSSNGVVTESAILWNGVYAKRVEAEEVAAGKFSGEFSGKLNGNADTASSTTGSLIFGNRNDVTDSDPKNIAQIFSYNGKNNTYLTTGDGLVIKVDPYNVAGSGKDQLVFQIGHSNTITAGTISGSSSNEPAEYESMIQIPSITYDAHGHITSVTTTSIKMPKDLLDGKPGSYYASAESVSELKQSYLSIGSIDNIEKLINDNW